MCLSISRVLILARKELQSFLDSLTAYILLVVFLGLCGFFTWLFGATVFYLKQASLQLFFGVSFWIFFFFMPAITMRALAEEQRTGTLELLCTKAISDWEVILGKFLACLALVVVALVCTLPYYVTVSALGPVDHGAVWGGYLGLLLLSSAYIALGLFASSLTNNQIVSFLLALCLGSLFHMLFGFMGNGIQGTVGKIFLYLSTERHYSAIRRGVIDSRDLLYFLSFITLCLYLAKLMLNRRKW